MKSVAAQMPRAGMTRDEFRGYYEDKHVPLALRHLPFTGYVRNHLIDAGDFPFATFTEFWARDFSDIESAMAGDTAAIMATDEAHFLRSDRIAAANAQEIRCSEKAPTGAPDERSLILVSWDDAARQDAIDALDGWARDIAKRQSSVSYDLLEPSPFATAPVPWNAILWLPDHQHAGPAPRLLAISALRARSFGNPPISS